MKKPDSHAAFFALIFGMVGGMLTAFGLWRMGRPGAGFSALVQFEIGVLILMAFGFCMMRAEIRRRDRYAMRRKGEVVQADSFQVDHHLGLRWNKVSPWTVLCRYTWKGKEYTARSPLLWTEPHPRQPVTLRIDPKRPKRAWVDVDALSKGG